MPKVRWEVVDAWQQMYRVSDRELAARLGYSASQLCDVRRGYREPSAGFIDCLGYELQMPYDQYLKHPRLSEPKPPARDALAIHKLADGRPWPKPIASVDDLPLTPSQAYRAEQHTARDLLQRPIRLLSKKLLTRIRRSL